jgi:hypothetical protein
MHAHINTHCIAGPGKFNASFFVGGFFISQGFGVTP